MEWPCIGKSFGISLFRLKSWPKTSHNIPSLHCVLSLIFKTICVVFLETFVIFLQPYRGLTLKGVIMIFSQLKGVIMET